MFSSVPYAFPATVQLGGQGAISDALVGRVRWDNRLVIYTLETLMDLKQHQSYIDHSLCTSMMDLVFSLPMFI